MHKSLLNQLSITNKAARAFGIVSVLFVLVVIGTVVYLDQGETSLELSGSGEQTASQVLKRWGIPTGLEPEEVTPAITYPDNELSEVIFTSQKAPDEWRLAKISFQTGLTKGYARTYAAPPRRLFGGTAKVLELYVLKYETAELAKGIYEKFSSKLSFEDTVFENAPIKKSQPEVDEAQPPPPIFYVVSSDNFVIYIVGDEDKGNEVLYRLVQYYAY